MPCPNKLSTARSTPMYNSTDGTTWGHLFADQHTSIHAYTLSLPHQLPSTCMALFTSPASSAAVYLSIHSSRVKKRTDEEAHWTWWWWWWWYNQLATRRQFWAIVPISLFWPLWLVKWITLLPFHCGSFLHLNVLTCLQSNPLSSYCWFCCNEF